MSQIVALADAVHLKARALPKAPDGRYDYQVKATTDTDQSADEQHSFLWKAQQRVQADSKFLGVFDLGDAVPDTLKALSSPGAIDDRTRIFNKAIADIGNLPPGSPLSKQLNDQVITLLYKTLAHPPATYLGTNNTPLTPYPLPSADRATTYSGAPQTTTAPTPSALPPRSPFAFRSADGSGNNALFPNLGKAGMPYARSVQGKHPLAPNSLPDPNLIFETLLKARDWKPHPGGNSAMTFAFASLVTHMLFRTDRVDPTINNTTSYLDLSILYGVNQAQQNSVRDKDKGCGFLFPDAFAEDRLVLVPPAATALLVILSRNHNYVAGMLLSINERGYWKNPSTLTADQRIVQDEEIFQTARLVNCGHFMSLIFGDYVAGFLGLGRTGNSWSMNPFDPIKDDMGNLLGRGEGNHCSVEFSLLYRWHHTTAQKDVQWTEDLFAKLFNTTNFDTITLADFGPAVARAWETFVDPNPRTREFGGIHRGADGKFSDDDIARILQDSTDNPAAAYRARGIPDALRIIEVMGIVQGRQWGVCTMNEFRAFLGLKTFDDFEDWSSDEDVAQAARQLYGHIDNLELYPGLQAEDCIPLGPGSGICCGYTMTRAILADAICLVRGDRFYTTDYTPYNLTAWGFQDCARDPNNGAFGAALPKLLFRHLPRHYPADNVYGLFPFFTPATTKQNLTDLGIVDKYKFNRPTALPIPKVVDTIQGIRNVFNDSVTFKTTYPTMQLLTEGYGFFLTFDSEKKQQHDKDKAWALHALYRDGDKNVMQGMVSYYVDSVKKLLKRESYKIGGIPGTRVDIVRNVINLMSVHWTADYLFDIDLKTEDNPMGLFTEQEVYDMLMVLFTCVFINVTPEHGWALTQGAIQVSGIINGLIQKSYNSVGSLLPPVCSIVYAHIPCADFLVAAAQEEALAGLHAQARRVEASREGGRCGGRRLSRRVVCQLCAGPCAGRGLLPRLRSLQGARGYQVAHREDRR
jgi:linoleate 10R-lipoxygenase